MTATDTPDPVDARAASSARSRPSRWRARVAGGIAAGALIVAAPLATVTSIATVASPVTAQVVGSTAGAASSLPTTLVLTSRRAGSVID